MLSVSPAFKQAVSANRKKYLVTANINLASGTILRLANADLWEGGGFGKEEAVSEDGKFTALGATIIGSATLSIKNQHEEYSSYDFTDATVFTFINIAGINENPVQTGTYTVDEATYTEASINLTLLDNMAKLDKPYEVSLTYPNSLYQIAFNTCLSCGLMFTTSTFPHYSFQIETEFDSSGLTCREVLGMCAAIAGCYVKCDPAGNVTFGWFDRTTLDSWITAYSNGNQTPAASYTNMHYITSLFSQDISVDPVVITGVRLVAEKEDSAGKKHDYTYTAGNPGYVIGIEKNKILNACSDAKLTEIKTWLGTQLVGLRFRKASISHASNPAIEAGDIAAVWDRKGRGYPILVTRTNFTAFDQQKTVSGAETPLRNAATRYSWSTKNYLEARAEINREKTLRELVEEQLRNAINNASGLYLTKVTQNGSTIYYLHNMSDLNSSPVRIMFSTAGITVTANGTAQNPTWYGLTASGTMLTNLLATTGLSFDWARGGTLSLGGDGNVNGVMQIMNSAGTVIGQWDKDGIVLRQVLGNYSIVEELGSIKYADEDITLRIVEGEVIDVLTWTEGNGLIVKYLNTTNISHTVSNIKGYFGVVPFASKMRIPIYTCGSNVEFTPTFADTANATSGSVTSLMFTETGFNYNYTRYSDYFDGATGVHQKVVKDKPFLICTSNNFRYASSGYREAFIAVYKDSNRVRMYSNSGGAELDIRTGGIYTNGADVNITDDVTISKPLTVSAAASITSALTVAGRLQVDTGYIELTTEEGFKVHSTSGHFGSSSNGNKVLEVLSPSGVDPGSIHIGVPIQANGNAGIKLTTTGTSVNRYAVLIGDAAGLEYNGTAVQMASSSSRRYKNSIGAVKDERLDPHRLLRLPVVQFIFNEGHRPQYLDMEGELIPGFIAEDVEDIYPSAAIHDPRTGQIESWDERRIIPGMLALIQEQDEKIRALEENAKEQALRIKELETKAKEQAERADALEKRLLKLERLADMLTAHP